MFAALRYFNPRYWASRFWPKLGGVPDVVGPPVYITGSVQATLYVTGTTQATMTATGSTQATLSITGSV